MILLVKKKMVLILFRGNKVVDCFCLEYSNIFYSLVKRSVEFILGLY